MTANGAPRSRVKLALGVDREALVVGMALVPGLCSRNKSFFLFEDPDVRRARRRASMLRGIVRQLAGAHGRVAGLAITRTANDGLEMRYRVPGVRLERRVHVSETELACVRWLAARAGAGSIGPSDDDRARIDASLRKLSEGLRLAEIERG